MKLGIAHQRRFLPSYTQGRELVADGAIGKVDLIASVSGSGLPNDASHHTDMYRYVLGDVECEWVMGQVERGTDRHERTRASRTGPRPSSASRAAPARRSSAS